MRTDDLIRRVREIARIGVVNVRHDRAVLLEAADRLEELDERVDIMMEGNRMMAEQTQMALPAE